MDHSQLRLFSKKNFRLGGNNYKLFQLHGLNYQGINLPNKNAHQNTRLQLVYTEENETA